MSHFEKILKCRYHTQDGPDSCGAAIASIILGFLENRHSDLEQAVVQEELTRLTNIEGVGTSPDALGWFLSERGAQFDFRGGRSRSSDDLNRRILSSVIDGGVPVAVAMSENAHWVVVEGVQTDVEPTGRTPCALRGVWIHNPVGNGDGQPPPHAEDDECGAGLMNRGLIREFVTARQWRLDTDATMRSFVREFRLGSVTIALPRTLDAPSIEQPVEHGTDLDEVQAVEAARSTFIEYGLDRHVRPVGELNPGNPLLVHLADDSSTQYFVVPWRDERGILAFSRIDRHKGWLRSVGFTGRPVGDFLISRSEIVQALANRFMTRLYSLSSERILVRGLQRRFDGWLANKVDESRLVWKFSLQSRSPYFPLREISSRPFQSRVFVDQGGMIFSDLTPPIPGG